MGKKVTMEEEITPRKGKGLFRKCLKLATSFNAFCSARRTVVEKHIQWVYKTLHNRGILTTAKRS